MKSHNRYGEHQSVQNGLNSQRNYSGTLHKAPSGLSYQTQRTVQIAKNQKISKNLMISSNSSTAHHHAVSIQNKHQLSGTAGSDSTALSRSGGRANGSANANISSSLVSGIPIHPKMTKQSTASGTLGITSTTKHHHGAKVSSGDFVTHQQQTPQMLSSSNSHAGLQNRPKQYCSSNANTQCNSQSLRGKGAGGVPDKSIGTAGVSSQFSQQKIAKFDFTHYDGQIEEQLRIPKQKNGQIDKKMKANSSRSSTHQNMNNLSNQKSYFTAMTSTRQQGINNEQQKQQRMNNQGQEALETGQTTPDILVMAQQMNMEKNENAKEAYEASQETPSQNFNNILPIDQQKMRQLQEGILQVRVGMGMMSSGFNGGSGLGKGSAELKNPTDSQSIEASEIKNLQENEQSRNDTNKINEKTYNSVQCNQSREKRYSSTNFPMSAAYGSYDEAKNQLERQTSKQEESDSTIRMFNTISVENLESNKENLIYEQIIQQNQKIKSKYSNHQLESSRSAQNPTSASQDGYGKVINSERGSNRSGQSSGPKRSSVPPSMRKPPAKSGVNLQIAIPDDNEGTTDEKSVKYPSNQKSDDSHNFQPGEENLAPSTEKKYEKKQMNPNNIPKTGTHFGQATTSKNIFLNKFQCNSTRNNANLRYHNVDAGANIGGKFDFGDVDSDNGDENKIEQSNKTEDEKMERKEDTNNLMSMAQISAERGSSQGPPAATTEVGVSGSKTAANPAQGLASAKSQFLQTSSQAQQKPEIKQLGNRSSSQSNVTAQNNSKSSNQIQSNATGGMNQGTTGLKTIDATNQDSRFAIQPAHKIIIPNDEPTKTSNKRNGVVRAYAANTNQGLVRNYNEDRVSIITNLLPPKNRKDIDPEKWPRCSYFGIYDGHGGALCADFLRDNLHHYVINEASFPQNPKEAIVNGFAKAEKAFMDKIYNPVTKELKDKSGSCAIVVLIVQDICYVANVGDSRAVLSSEEGRRVYPLSLDHKPGEDSETQRIREAGGEIYYRTATNQIITYDHEKMNKYQQFNLAGPLRVLPGRLSVARTFGDPEAKIPDLNGNPNVVIHNPDIKSFQIKKEHDYIVLGCDGIFDKMSNSDSTQCVWRAAYDNKHHPSVKGQAQDIHKMCGMGIEYILKNSLLRRSLDNVTVVIIGFNNFKHAVFGHSQQQQQTNSENGDQSQKADTTGQRRDEQTKCIDAKASLQNQNSHGALHQQNLSKLQKDQDSKKTFERTKSANLPRHQLNQHTSRQQQFRENTALKISGTGENESKNMNIDQSSHAAGASRSSISTSSTMGHGATKNGALKTSKSTNNNENDDPNQLAKNNLQTQKSKEILRHENRMQQLLQYKQQITGQIVPQHQQQIKSARPTYYNNGMKPPMASCKASNGNILNNHSIQKQNLKAPRTSFQESGEQQRYQTTSGAVASTLASSHTHQNLHYNPSANPIVSPIQQQLLKHKNVTTLISGYPNQLGQLVEVTQQSSRPVQIHQNLYSRDSKGSRSHVRVQQRLGHYNTASQTRSNSIKLLPQHFGQGENTMKQQKIVQVRGQNDDIN